MYCLGWLTVHRHLFVQTNDELFITSVCRMAARCSLAVRDSLSTSICCLQSEFWLLSVSSFVCRANSSDSFFDNSCLSWSIYRCTSTTNHIHSVMFCYHGRCDTEKEWETLLFFFTNSELRRTAFALFSSMFFFFLLSLKMHLGLTPLHSTYIIHHLYSWLMKRGLKIE